MRLDSPCALMLLAAAMSGCGSEATSTQTTELTSFKAVATVFKCPSGGEPRSTIFDQAEPPDGVTLEEAVNRIPSAVVSEATASRAVAVVQVDGS
jgi:hypothetical protein